MREFKKQYLKRNSSKKVTAKVNEHKFDSYWLDKLEAKTNIFRRQNGSYSFDSRKGIIDYYPKKDKLLIRGTNKWINNGLSYIFNILL